MDTTDHNDWSQSAMVGIELSVANILFRGYNGASVYSEQSYGTQPFDGPGELLSFKFVVVVIFQCLDCLDLSFP